MHGEEAQLEILLTNDSHASVQIRNVTWTSNPIVDSDICVLKTPNNLDVPVRGTEKITILLTGGDRHISKNKAASLDSRMPARHTRHRSVDDQFNSINLNEQHSDKLSLETLYEFEFKVSYSSDDKCDHFREFVKKLKVYMSPSAMVTRWDVIPSETLNKSYLVLDIENFTESELEICYDSVKKLIIMEPSDGCRIPLSIERFEIPTGHDDRIGACMNYLKEKR